MTQIAEEDGLHSKKDSVLKFATSYAIQDIGDIDEAMQVAISGTTKSVLKINPGGRGWDGVVMAFSNLTLIKQRGEEHSKYDSYIRSGGDRFKVDRWINKVVVNDIKKWFEELVCDQNVIEEAHINLDEIADIVGARGEAITKLDGDSTDKNYREKSIVESGVLCYPHDSDPRFELYCIRLVAWANYEGGPLKSNSNGVRGAYLKRIYEPNREIIERMKEEIRDQAAEDGKTLMQV